MLYTSILPLVETGEITTFLKEFIRYPAMPLRQASDLATPNYLHRSSWQTATTTFRFNIGNKYSMERIKEAAGQQELVRDAAQIAMSFQQHVVLLAVDGLKMAHKPLIDQRRAAGKYDTEDVLSASEFQVMHFCAVQKTKPHAWTAYIQAVKEIMLRYDGSPTILVTDVKLKPSFVKNEYTKFSETGEPSLPNVTNPSGTMSRATPIENIVYLSFIPERLASKQSPMHELTQIGGWHPGIDVPNLLHSNEYASTYNNLSRALQLYDAELNSFATISLAQMAENAHMFNEQGHFISQILDSDRSPDDGTYVADLFSTKDFKDGRGKMADTVTKSHASMFLKSIGTNFARWANKSVSELAQNFNDGVELYKQMAKSGFDVKNLHKALENTLISKGLPLGAKSLTEIIDAVVDKDIGTLEWRMNDLDCKEVNLENPLTGVSGFLSWPGFEALYRHYSKQSRGDKDKADREWVVLARFVESVKQLVAFVSDYLPSCALIKRVKYPATSAFHRFEKTEEETLCDQIWNFNATFPLLLHKGSFLQWSSNSQQAGELLGVNPDVDFVPLTTNNAAKAAQAIVNMANGKGGTNLLKVIYDRLIFANFSEHLSHLKKILSKTDYKIVLETIKFDNILAEIVTASGPQKVVMPAIPQIKLKADFAASGEFKLEANVPTTIDKLKEQWRVGQIKNLPHVSKYHWLLVSNWQMTLLFNYLVAVYQLGSSNASDVASKLSTLSDLVPKYLRPTSPNPKLIDIKTKLKVGTTDLSDATTIGATINDKTLENAIAALDTVAGTRVENEIAAVKTVLTNDSVWTNDFSGDSDVYKKHVASQKANFLSDVKKILPDFNFIGNEYGDIGEELQITEVDLGVLDSVPILKKIPSVVKELKSKIKDASTELTEDLIVKDVAVKPHAGTLTKHLKVILNVGSDESKYLGNVAYYGDRTRFSQSEGDVVKGKKSQSMNRFDDDVDVWIRTPFRLSKENAQSMFASSGRSENMEMRIEYANLTLVENYYDRTVAGNPFKSNVRLEGVQSSLADKDTFEQLVREVTLKGSERWNWIDLPFLDADLKCQIHLTGLSLKTKTERHYHDLLFGIRLHENETRASDAIENAWSLIKANTVIPSHYDIALGLMAFATIWNKRLSDIFIDRNVYYPIDFIVFRPWINLLTVLGFLLRPGVDALGFISTSHADKMSSATAMDKTGIVHCSIWCGVVFNNPANVKKVPNLSCIGFGAGFGSAFYSIEQIRDHLSHKEYRPIQKGTTSPSLLVALIPKGSAPKRTMISLSGYIPDHGQYMNHGLVLNESERAYSPESLKTLAHYPTAEYYGKHWNLNADANSVASSLNMDATSSGNNLICHLGTTRYYNPITGGFDYIILNTGPIGPDEGPGLREALMTGTPFPAFNYATDPLYKTITV